MAVKTGVGDFPYGETGVCLIEYATSLWYQQTTIRSTSEGPNGCLITGNGEAGSLGLPPRLPGARTLPGAANMLEGRKEARTPVRLLVHILSVRDPRLTELVAVENLSARGARVTAQRSWEPGSHVVIKSPSGVLGDRARVVYCQKIGENKFTVGLDFITQTSDWDSRNGEAGVKGE